MVVEPIRGLTSASFLLKVLKNLCMKISENKNKCVEQPKRLKETGNDPWMKIKNTGKRVSIYKSM